MKTAHLFLFLLVGLVNASFAQQGVKMVKTVKISTPTVQCEKCKKRIEDYLKREEGIQSVIVNYRSKFVTVKYWTDRTNEENIKTAIANVGYDAGDVKANEEAYNRLPDCCKKDGAKKKH